MECNTEERECTERAIYTCLDTLSKLYNKDPLQFLNKYPRTPYSVMRLLREAEISTEIENEDLRDYLKEVQYLFISTLNKYNKELYKDNLKPLTLRYPNDIHEFLYVMTKLVYIYNNDFDLFIKVFPQMPQAYWDKVDELREASYKKTSTSKINQSVYFVECLEKCKLLSFAYSNYINPIINEDEY